MLLFDPMDGRYLTPHIVPRPLDLSEVTTLKDVMFERIWPNVQWITATLRTAKSTNLRKITITISSRGTLVHTIGETIRREWQDLDQLLDQLWTSRSICPNITYEEGGTATGSGELVLSLLPKLASKGAVNRAGGCH